MKDRYWNVSIEVYDDGIVKAGVIRSRAAIKLPVDGYMRQPKREVYSVWFDTEETANSAAMEARSWSTDRTVMVIS